MSIDTDNFPDDVDELKELLRLSNLKIKHLKEEVAILLNRLYSPKSEKVCDNENKQLCLFDATENPPEEANEPDESEEVIVASHNRKKKGRRKIPDNLPVVEELHDISEEEKLCECGCMMDRIGEEVTKKLDLIPEKVMVVHHIRPKYACKNCEGLDSEGGTIKIAPVSPQLIPKGIASAGMIAYILIAKFCDSLPFYRQEKQFARRGFDLSRQNMSSWAIKIAIQCQILMELLMLEIHSGPLIQADETTVQVLKEPNRRPTTKSYMWVFRGGSQKDPIIIFQYHPSRSGQIAQDFLKNYKGIIQTDGYVGYNFLDAVNYYLHVGCWAHVRRQFMDAIKAGSGKRSGLPTKVIKMIKKLYKIEKEAKQKNMTPDEIYHLRQKKAKPILKEIKSYLTKKRAYVTPESLSGKAINYTLNQWDRLENYIKDGNAKIDNNLVENAVRPFAVGRKNWLFSGSQAGARASALLYSLIETARANGLEPYAYFRFLLEKLPTTPPEKMATLLPTRLKAEDLVLAKQHSVV